MASVLLLNIGNTHTQCAVGSDGRLSGLTRFRTSDLWERPDAIDRLALPELACLAASVVPRALPVLLDRLGADRVRVLTPALVPQVDFSHVDVSTLGADRLANLAAAVAGRRPPAIVLDCGTAITTEAVDAEHRFRGGAIIPGRAMCRRALHEYTAQLPWVDCDSPLPADLAAALGTNTRDAIRAGTDLALVGAVARVVADTRRTLGGADCPVLTVGGDAAFFLAHIPGLTAGGSSFTLEGLAAAARSL